MITVAVSGKLTNMFIDKFGPYHLSEIKLCFKSGFVVKYYSRKSLFQFFLILTAFLNHRIKRKKELSKTHNVYHCAKTKDIYILCLHLECLVFKAYEIQKNLLGNF